MPLSGSGTGTPISAPSAITRSAVDTSAPILPLDEWRRLMGMNPWHFWQLENSSLPARDSCSPLLFNYAWQNVDTVGRRDILEAIASAEEKLTRELGFSPAPTFRSDRLAYPAYYDIRQNLGGANARGGWPGIQLRTGYISALGVEHLDYVTEVPVAFTDEDGDGIEETWVISFATTVTDPKALAVYFATADRFGDTALANRWRIAPVFVAISSGVATIKGRAWTLVKPSIYERYEPIALDPSDSGNFVTRVQVWSRSVYTGDQGSLNWESIPLASCEDTSDPSGYLTAVARYTIRDARIGIVAGGAASYNASTGTYSASVWPVNYLPTTATVNYYGGYPADESGAMDSALRQMVARLATAELARPVCGCRDQNREFYRWQVDLSLVSPSAEEQYAYSQFDLDHCPWGTRRGHITVWRSAQTLKRRYGVAVG